MDCKDHISKESKILDLGCGSAIVAKCFEEFFNADVLGVDIKDMRIEDIPFKIIDKNNLPFSDNSFDIVLIAYVLHHCEDPIFLLKEAQRVSKDKIIIYEDLPDGFFSGLFCKMHSFIFHYFFQENVFSGKIERKRGESFKNIKEWKQVFKDLNLTLIDEKKASLNIMPINKKLFVLKKA